MGNLHLAAFYLPSSCFLTRRLLPSGQPFAAVASWPRLRLPWITSSQDLFAPPAFSLPRGLHPLSNLTRLTALSLRGCRKLTNQAVEALRPLQQLRQLCLCGVARLSDRGLGGLAALGALTQLELGHTRVKVGRALAWCVCLAM